MLTRISCAFLLLASFAVATTHRCSRPGINVGGTGLIKLDANEGPELFVAAATIIW